tara:strand:+ start:45 stop:275 length:231 start_codon:yes stop_codon:yes gene_type:complete
MDAFCCRINQLLGDSVVMNNKKFKHLKAQDVQALIETIDKSVLQYCDEKTISGETAWALIQGLSDVRLEQFRDSID